MKMFFQSSEQENTSDRPTQQMSRVGPAMGLFIIYTMEDVRITKLKQTLSIQYYIMYVMFLFSRNMF